MSAPEPSQDFGDIDHHVDAEIAACLNQSSPRSFFLFAGAGSGKTRSLVIALEHIRTTLSETLKVKGQKVAVITFTNAASDEIKSRLQHDPLIDVRTIHSFAWSLIDGFNHDIREWLRDKLQLDIDELHASEAKGRPNTKASLNRRSEIAAKTRRHQSLDSIRRFVYSPTSDNRTRDSLSHAEVLQLTSHLLTQKPAMQAILVGRYPILLVDESQDTNKHLMNALFLVQEAQKNRFVLGLLGDMMQRIYFDGKEGLGQNLPEGWVTPGKRMNYRCPKRVVSLINKVRSTADQQWQVTPASAAEGHVRFFILSNGVTDKQAAEAAIGTRMAAITGDEGWAIPTSVKTLTLEHRMAASRLGFLDMFSPLYDVQSWRTSFLEGSLPVTRFFAEDVLPLVRAQQGGDHFEITRLVKARSPLLAAEALRNAADARMQLQKALVALDMLMELWSGGTDPRLIDILQCVAQSGLLEIPESLKECALREADSEIPAPGGDEVEDRQNEKAAAIEEFLRAPFSQLEAFASYLAGNAHFDTHQGVKGREFDRVMVIMDDEEAKGFSFKYENLFGGRAAGEGSVEATRRLFYVTCSRAKRSLALVAYTGAQERIRRFVLQEGWFSNDEIVTHL